MKVGWSKKLSGQAPLNEAPFTTFQHFTNPQWNDSHSKKKILQKKAVLCNVVKIELFEITTNHSTPNFNLSLKMVLLSSPIIKILILMPPLYLTQQIHKETQRTIHCYVSNILEINLLVNIFQVKSERCLLNKGCFYVIIHYY